MHIKQLILNFVAIITSITSVHADTIEHYMNIANRIPQMEIKADAQSQTWARSARIVLDIASEGIAETLLQANEVAKNQGKPLFCLPAGIQLNAALLGNLIQQTYNGLSSQQSDKNTMTVSQVAWLGVSKTYPCGNNKVS
jgi:hypothetical protein